MLDLHRNLVLPRWNTSIWEASLKGLRSIRLILFSLEIRLKVNNDLISTNKNSLMLWNYGTIHALHSYTDVTQLCPSASKFSPLRALSGGDLTFYIPE